MMPILHICNLQFEKEIQGKSFSTVSYEPFSQLQFLPLLYGSSEDGLLVEHRPSEAQIPLKLHFHDETKNFFYERIESWGYSKWIARWAKERGIPYSIPPWEVVQKIHNKAFAFEFSQLQGASLIYDSSQLKGWLKKQEGRVVLKSCYGSAGRGHFLMEADETWNDKLQPFVESGWKNGQPLIAQPWVRRILDFSTQWEVSPDKQITYLGTTVCENDEEGKYMASRAGEKGALFGSFLPLVEKQQCEARAVLKKVADLGYFGNLGIDSMIYTLKGSTPLLEPFVEINARKTMGWVALKIHMRHFPHQLFRMSYRRKKREEKGELPSGIYTADGSKITFLRNLFFSIQ